ncbi:unnamed protein product, partial [Phaeothamnion confervicola]
GGCSPSHWTLGAGAGKRRASAASPPCSAKECPGSSPHPTTPSAGEACKVVIDTSSCGRNRTKLAASRAPRWWGTPIGRTIAQQWGREQVRSGSQGAYGPAALCGAGGGDLRTALLLRHGVRAACFGHDGAGGGANRGDGASRSGRGDGERGAVCRRRAACDLGADGEASGEPARGQGAGGEGAAGAFANTDRRLAARAAERLPG